jgi:Na+/proline symporter
VVSPLRRTRLGTRIRAGVLPLVLIIGGVNDMEQFIIWVVGVIFTLIIQVARYGVIRELWQKYDSLADYFADGAFAYAIAWPATVPAHMLINFILWMGAYVGARHAHVVDRRRLPPAAKDATVIHKESEDG